MTNCPICLSTDGSTCAYEGSWGRDNQRHNCETCGIFGTTVEAREYYLDRENLDTTRYVRAALSHWIRTWQAKKNDDQIPLVTSDLVKSAISNDIILPNPGEQAANIIRYIGDITKITGEGIQGIDRNFHSIVGSISREFAMRILFDLEKAGQIAAIDASDSSGADALDVTLTLLGWQTYETEQKGKFSGSYGFVALKFGDPVLDSFLRDHVRPAMRSIGMEIRDMRDSAKAGIIDNLMRAEIRDAAFVLADLTHDNFGAYWEAGFAEGLGKPVLYICEKSKFEEAQTHFDTNHCTTVVWDTSNPDQFIKELIATLKRSLVI